MIRKYEKYRDSGVEWIGEIPEGWGCKNLRYVLKAGNDGIKIGPFGSALKSEFLTTDGYKVYGQENVINNDFVRGFRHVDEIKFRELEVYEVLPGDLLITMMGTTGLAKLVPSTVKKGIMDSHLIRVRPDESQIKSDYLQILVNDSAYIFYQKKLLSNGSIMEGLNSSIIKSFTLLLPPLNEQAAIASFLDHKTAQIDQLIARKEKLIALYEEEKAVIISHAVTKGLDPTVKTKPSGVDWLGDIPEHWEVKRLKYVANMKSGDGITSDQIKEFGDYPVYGGNGLRGHFDSFTHEGNYVLIGRQGALCGNINYAIGKFWASEHAIVCTLIKHCETRWFGELLRVMNLNQYSVSAAQPGLSIDNIKILQIPVPPISEQTDIVAHIETEFSRLNTIIYKFKKQIELFKEYRTTLISEVVTGKIDVRGEVAA